MKVPLSKPCKQCGKIFYQKLENNMSEKRFINDVSFCSHPCWVEYNKKHPSGFRKFTQRFADEKRELDETEVRENEIIDELVELQNRAAIAEQRVDQWVGRFDIAKVLKLSS